MPRRRTGDHRRVALAVEMGRDLVVEFGAAPDHHEVGPRAVGLVVSAMATRLPLDEAPFDPRR